MRTHGWGGSPPSSDAEAIQRIKDATHRCVTSQGSATIQDVAAELGVTRQTVYRYFASTEALLIAAAEEGTEQYLRKVAKRLRPITDPGETLVEAIAYTIERVSDEPYLALLLAGTPHSLVGTVTSHAARAVGRSLIEQSSAVWDSIDPEDVEEIIEWTLRTVQSFLVDPGQPARSRTELRAFLRRWLVPAVEARTGSASRKAVSQ